MDHLLLCKDTNERLNKKNMKWLAMSFAVLMAINHGKHSISKFIRFINLIWPVNSTKSIDIGGIIIILCSATEYHLSDVCYRPTMNDDDCSVCNVTIKIFNAVCGSVQGINKLDGACLDSEMIGSNLV